MQDLILMKDMSDSQRLMFQNELKKKQKNATTAVLLTLFLGGVGAHHYYLGRTSIGILYSVFFWTFIPGIIAFVELFLVSNRVKKYNEIIALDTANYIKQLIN